MKKFFLGVLTFALFSSPISAEEWSGKGQYQVDKNPETVIKSLDLDMNPVGRFKLGIDLSGDGFYIEGSYQTVQGGAVLTVDRAFDTGKVNGRALLLDGADGKPAHIQGFFNYPEQNTFHHFYFPQEWATTYVDTQHTTETSVDWNGIYQGVLPCADCEGIKTVLTLNSDYTYAITRTYMGKRGKSFSHKGGFKFINNGSTVVLQGVQGPSKYFIGEGYARQLDMEGAAIGGSLADHYVLKMK